MEIHTIEQFLPDILKQFNLLEAYLFFEEKDAYMIIKRGKNMPLQNWDIFERIVSNNFNFENLFLISIEELNEKELKDVKKSALYIKGGYENE